MVESKLKPGDEAPDFTLPNQDATPVSLSDFRGRNVLVYFYPADDTPGCTREACGFNDNLSGFQAADTPVIGISPDPGESHQRFRTKYGLRFPLLSDPDHEVMDAYGAWGERTQFGKKTVGVIRSTFLIDPGGRVTRAWYQVRAEGHAEQVLAELST
jgi:peroxiredoxin Q/BCP